LENDKEMRKNEIKQQSHKNKSKKSLTKI